MKQTIKEVALEYINSEHENNFYAEDITVTLVIRGDGVDVESIFYSKDEDKVYLHVGCEEFEGDIDIESLSDANQERMRMVFFCAEPQEVEFYSIEPDGKGGKQIHILGFTYASDNKTDDYWRVAEGTFMIVPLQEFIDNLKADVDYVGNLWCDTKQYEGDYTEQQVRDMMNDYFDGHRADRLLQYSEITMDTPCGNYMHY